MSVYGLSRAESAQRLLASAWSYLLAQFNDDMSDEAARDVGDATRLIHQAQLEVLAEEESRRAAWKKQELTDLLAKKARCGR